MGFGTEIDIRDKNRKLLISNDMPDANPMPLEVFGDLQGSSGVPAASSKHQGGRSVSIDNMKQMHGIGTPDDLDAHLLPLR
jgi:hypothetical protein